MFNPFKLPSYEEARENTEKLFKDLSKFYSDWYEDVKKYFNNK